MDFFGQHRRQHLVLPADSPTRSTIRCATPPAGNFTSGATTSASSRTQAFAFRPASRVSLPAGSTPYLRFRHAYAFEDSASGASRYDGGVLEYSTDDGGSWQDTNGFAGGDKVNWYNGQIANGFGNPLAGRMAFTAESNGYISSRLNLSSLAGQTMRFRWRIGTDTVVDDWGWMIDDVAIYTCVDPIQFFLPLIMK